MYVAPLRTTSLSSGAPGESPTFYSRPLRLLCESRDRPLYERRPPKDSLGVEGNQLLQSCTARAIYARGAAQIAHGASSLSRSLHVHEALTDPSPNLAASYPRLWSSSLANGPAVTATTMEVLSEMTGTHRAKHSL
jgi:hypothetical protein